MGVDCGQCLGGVRGDEGHDGVILNAVVTSEMKLKQNNFVSVLFQTWLHVK